MYVTHLMETAKAVYYRQLDGLLAMYRVEWYVAVFYWYWVRWIALEDILAFGGQSE